MSIQNGENNVLDKLIAKKSSLPAKQEKLASYILENYQDIGLLTVKELADRAGVGTTTVMRLIKNLGYDSFFDLKRELYRMNVDYLNKWETVQKSYGNFNDNESYNVLTSVFNEGIRLIEQSVNSQLVENFTLALDLIEKASTINILGLRIYRYVAFYLEHMLGEFWSKTKQLSHDTEALYDKILQFEKDEVLIIFSFAHYTQRTVDAAELAHEQGVKIILITDLLSCPISEYADVILKLETGGKYYTILPIIALVEALVIEFGKRKSDVSVERIKRLERKLLERNILLQTYYQTPFKSDMYDKE